MNTFLLLLKFHQASLIMVKWCHIVICIDIDIFKIWAFFNHSTVDCFPLIMIRTTVENTINTIQQLAMSFIWISHINTWPSGCSWQVLALISVEEPSTRRGWCGGGGRLVTSPHTATATSRYGGQTSGGGPGWCWCWQLRGSRDHRAVGQRTLAISSPSPDQSPPSPCSPPSNSRPCSGSTSW